LAIVWEKPKLDDDQIAVLSIELVAASAAGFGVTLVVARFGATETVRPLESACE